MDMKEKILKAAEKKVRFTKEAELNSATIKKLKQTLPGIAVFKHKGGPSSIRGHSDIYGCYCGRAFFLEGKLPGKSPNESQEIFIEKLSDAGAIVGIYHTPEEAIAIIESSFKNPSKQRT